MTVKLPKILALILLTIHATFAQAEPCKDETLKTGILYEMCGKFAAPSSSYADCMKLYMEQKAKSDEACNVAAPAAAEAAEVAPAEETALEPEPVLVPAPAPVARPAVPKLVPLAQALRASGLSGACVDDFESVLGRDGFSMGKFVKELPPAVAKVKVQMKSPFGKPKDSDRTNVGLTVGCIKALPESPAEIQGLLKNISLKAGLDFAADAAASAAEDYISTNIPKESDSGGGVFKTVMSVGLIGGGLGSLIYGFTQDSKVSDSIKEREGKAAIEARDSRNMGYGIGAGLLAAGLGVVVFF